MLLRRLLNVFVNKVDPDQAALVRAACSGSTLSCVWGYEISDHICSCGGF